jgi:colanic acid/amylovoran biosynthesis glycosyltransferase
MMRKTVAHASLYYFKLSENWIHTQIKHLPDWDSLVLTNEIKNLETVNWHPRVYERRRELPFGVRELDSIAMKLVGYYPSFYRRIKKEGAQLIHAHFGPMGFLCLSIAKKLNIPLVTTFYGYDASELPRQEPSWEANYEQLFAEGDRFLVEGPAMGEKLEALGCPPQKIRLQRLGIEPAEYPARGSHSKSEKLRILMVGRFVEKKGFIHGLKAFHRFLLQGGSGTLTIVGDSNATDSSRDLKNQMHHFVEEHDLRHAVEFKGLLPMHALRKEYQHHEVFMAPSVEAGNGDDEGGLPVTVIEAAAAGMALLGSRHCDIPEVIKQQKTGLLFKERDVHTLAEHLLKLGQHPELRQTFGREAAALIRRNHDAEKQGQKLAGIYDEVLGWS